MAIRSAIRVGRQTLDEFNKQANVTLLETSEKMLGKDRRKNNVWITGIVWRNDCDEAKWARTKHTCQKLKKHCLEIYTAGDAYNIVRCQTKPKPGRNGKIKSKDACYALTV